MALHEIRVHEELSDPRADELQRRANLEGLNVDVAANRVYYIEGVTDEQAKLLADHLLSDPVTQTTEITARTDWDNGRKIEVSPQPGVTNREKGSMEYGASLLGVHPAAVDSGTEYTFSQATSTDTVGRTVTRLLVNETVDRVRIEAPLTLTSEAEPAPVKILPIRSMSDGDILQLSKDRKLALNLRDMQAIKGKALAMGRDVYDGEAEYLGAAWSEHCCHKTTNANIITPEGQKPSIFSRIKEMSTPYFDEQEVLSAFGDNSGAFRFYRGTAINIKLETHNSPRLIEPGGGAATGTGGVLRDINETGLGARPINSMHMDFVAPLDMPDAEVPPGTLTPRQLLPAGS